MFAEVTLRVVRLADPVTFRVPPRTENAFRVVMLASKRLEVPETLRPVRIPTDVTLGWAGWDTTRATLAFATFPNKFEELRFERPEAFPIYKRAVTVERLDVPVTFKFVPKIDSTFAVVTLVPERLEVPETFRPDRIPTDVTLGWAGWDTTRATLAFATFPTKLEEFRFERPEAFPICRPPFKMPVTVRAAMFAVVTTLMFEQSKLETAPFAALRKPVFDVLVLRRLKKATLAPSPPVTLAVVNQPVAMLAVPETLRFTRVPKLVIFDWVFESWRDVRAPTRFDECRLEIPEPLPV